jgi:hypothetical protein
MMVSHISQNAHIATGTVTERFLSKPRTIAHKPTKTLKLAEVLGVYVDVGKMIEPAKTNREKYIMF